MTIRIARKHSRIGKRNGVRTACWFTLSRGMTVGETENHTVEQGRVCGSCGFPCAVLACDIIFGAVELLLAY